MADPAYQAAQPDAIAVASSVSARTIDIDRGRAAAAEPITDPIAMPAITVANVPAKAYVDGPVVRAKTRVHTISLVSVAKPESTSSVAASHQLSSGAAAAADSRR